MGSREKQKLKKTNLTTAQTVGIVLFVVSVFVFLCLITGGVLFGYVGKEIFYFVIAAMGVFSYAFFAALGTVGMLLLAQYERRPGAKRIVALAFAVFFLMILLQLATTSAALRASSSFGGYISLIYKSGLTGLAGANAGGVVFGTLLYPLYALIGKVGCYIALSILFLVAVYLSIDFKTLFRYQAQPVSGRKIDGVISYDIEGGGRKKGEPTPPLQVIPFGGADSRRTSRSQGGSYDIMLNGIRETPAAAIGSAPPVADVAKPIPPQPPKDAAPSAKDILFHGADSKTLESTSYVDSYADRNKPDIVYSEPVSIPVSAPPETETRPSIYADSETATFVHDETVRSTIPTTPVRARGDSFESSGRRGAKSPLLNQIPMYVEEGEDGSVEYMTPEERAHREKIERAKREGYIFDPQTFYGQEEETRAPILRAADLPKKKTEESLSIAETSAPIAPAKSDEEEELERLGNIIVGMEDGKPITLAEKQRREREALKAAATPSKPAPVERVAPKPITPERVAPKPAPFVTTNAAPTAPEQEPIMTGIISDSSFRRAQTQTAEHSAEKEPTKVTERFTPFAKDTQAEEGEVAQNEPLTVEEETPPAEVIYEEKGYVDAEPEAETPNAPIVRTVEDAREAELREQQSVQQQNEGYEEEESEEEESEEAYYESETPIQRKRRANYPYNTPDIDIFADPKNDGDEWQSEIEDVKTRLLEIFTERGMPLTVENVSHGPTVTRYELRVPNSVRMDSVLGLRRNIEMLMRGSVRLEAPIEGTELFGIEAANATREIVMFKEVATDPAFMQSSSPTMFAMGKDVAGNNVIMDLAKCPHLLIAGSTGSGKSVCLNCILASFLLHASPNDLKLLLIDPKKVEFNDYQGLPHMLIDEIVDNTERALAAFRWAIKEMERRYTMFAEKHVRNIEGYNRVVDLAEEDTMYRIVIVVDEFADLMESGAEVRKSLESSVKRLSAKARACGIHILMATQRPSVKVVTGDIKNNLPSRIAFRVGSPADAMTVGFQGANDLLGKGDMLYQTPEMRMPVRAQSAYIDDAEMLKFIQSVKDNNEAEYDQDIKKEMFEEEEAEIVESNSEPTNVGGIAAGDAENQKMLPRVLKLGIERKQISIAMVQRYFGMGYARAGKLIDQLDKLGYISGFDGAKARQVYMTMEEFIRIYGDIDV